MQTILVPDYFSKFSCIGSDCDDNCCNGWEIHIDKKTYQKYKQVLNNKELNCFSRYNSNKHDDRRDNHYSVISSSPEGLCPFLTTVKLCHLQLKYGEEYLSNICYTYPRVTNQINGHLEKSLSMACPEAARLALLNPSIMVFNALNIDDTRPIFSGILDTNSAVAKKNGASYFWDLRIFTIRILQNREYSIDERLIILGLFYNKARETLVCGVGSELPEIVSHYDNMIIKGNYHELLNELPVDNRTQVQLLKEIIDERLQQKQVPGSYLTLVDQLNQGLITVSSERADTTDRYLEAYRKYYFPVMCEHEYILENYLVNYVFQSMFPFAGFRDVFEDYFAMIMQYALIKMHLVGTAAFYHGLELETTIKVIHVASKAIEHNREWVKAVMDLLRKNNYATLGHAVILLKNEKMF